MKSIVSLEQIGVLRARKLLYNREGSLSCVQANVMDLQATNKCSND
jgi:hypothetical protein